jgi:hypothetical protein
MGTTLRMSSAYHPQTDRLTERTNRAIEQIMRNFVNDYQNYWDEHLTAVQFAMNSSKHASTKISPLGLIHGREPTTPISLLTKVNTKMPAVNNLENDRATEIERARKHVEEAQKHQEEYANKTRREMTFKVGDRIRLNTKNTPSTWAQHTSYVPGSRDHSPCQRW